MFLLDPWIYRDIAGNQRYTLENIFAPAINNLINIGHDVKLLIGEDMYLSIVKNGINILSDIKVVSLKDLYTIYPNHYEAHKTQFNQQDTVQQINKFSKIVNTSLGQWVPDVLITFTTPVSILKKIYPQTLCLQFENGLFSRTPYPYLCQLDPFGFLKKSYPAIFAKQLREETITNKQMERILALKEIFKERIFKPHNPFRREKLCGKTYNKLVLVPLSYNGVIINDEASEFKSQLDFLLHVLYSVPKNTRVLVTKHSLQMDRSLHPETELFLQEKFSNLMFDEEFDRYAFASQWLTPLVDAVVSLNSTVAYHAAFWNKKVFSLGNCEINSVGTSNSINDIEQILSKPEGLDTCATSVLYHLLTRYCFVLESFFDPEYLVSRFNQLLTTDNNLFSCMPLVEQNEDVIFKKIIQATPGLKPDFRPRTWEKFNKEK